MTSTGTAAGTQTVLLLGADHPRLRDVAAGGLPVSPADDGARPGWTLGAALCAGWMPKTVPAVEPNEDGVLLALGPAAALLAVADGHNGSAASAAALRALADRVPGLLEDPGRGGAPVDGEATAAACAQAAACAVAAAVETGGRAAPPARTALSLAVVTAEAFFAVSFGDCVIAVVRRRRLRTVGRCSEFLGPELTGDPLLGHPVTRHRRRRGDVLMLTTDGVPDYLGRAFPAVAARLARADGDGG
jgi:hypothetical protein